MNKRGLIEMFIGLSYNSGYQRGREDLKQEQELKRKLDEAFRKGQAHEAGRNGNIERVADIVAGRND